MQEYVSCILWWYNNDNNDDSYNNCYSYAFDLVTSSKLADKMSRSLAANRALRILLVVNQGGCN